jgi:hypothetical protein
MTGLVSAESLQFVGGWAADGNDIFAPKRRTPVEQAWEEFLADARVTLGYHLTDYDDELRWSTGSGVRFLWEQPLDGAAEESISPSWYFNINIDWIDSDQRDLEVDINDLHGTIGVSYDHWLVTGPQLIGLTPRLLVGGSWTRVDQDTEAGRLVTLECDIRVRFDDHYTFVLTPGLDYVDSSQLATRDDSFVNRHLVASLSWTF